MTKHIDGKEVLEILIKFSSKETGLKEGCGRGEEILCMRLVWTMCWFSSLSQWSILGWSHPHPWVPHPFIGFWFSSLHSCLAPFPKFYIYIFISLLDISTEKSHSFLKYNKVKTKLDSFCLDFLLPSFPSCVPITEFGTVYMSSLLACTFTKSTSPVLIFFESVPLSLSPLSRS